MTGNFDDLLDNLKFEEKEEDKERLTINQPVDEALLHSSYRRLRLLYEYFERIDSEIDPDIVINMTLDFLEQQVGYDAVLVVGTDRSGAPGSVLFNRNYYENADLVISEIAEEGLFQWTANRQKPYFFRVDPQGYFCLILSLSFGGQSLGFLITFFSEEEHLSQLDLEMAKILCHQLAAVMDKSQLNEQLTEKEDTVELQLREITRLYDELKFVFDFTRKVGRVLEKEALYSLVLETVVMAFEVEKAVIFEVNKGKLKFIVGSGLGGIVTGSPNEGTNVAAHFLNSAEPINDFIYNENFRNWTHLGIEENTMLGSPITVEEQVAGLILLAGRKMNLPFNPGHGKLIRSMMRQVGYGLEQIRLYEEMLEKKKIERDMELAGRIQQSLLPKAPPVLPGFDFGIYFQPAGCVGGDYFDFLVRDDGCIVGVVADVSGKGIAAAMLMMNVRSVIRAESMQQEFDLSRAMVRINNLVCDEILPSKFVTLFYFLIDPVARSFNFISAGHTPLLHFKMHEKKFAEYTATSVPVGLVRDEHYVVRSLQLKPGDRLLIYTDGLNESRDTDGNEFGIEHVKELLRDSGRSGAAQTADKIACAWQSFTAGAPKFDDTTFLVIDSTQEGVHT
ncbi:MAG: SpoIIE family protein phosphatase [Candidatus Wallbacteria bacterium]|nr:SpoIIE family protein phosphatase [Candidatus Wallbacteria bacterium]